MTSTLLSLTAALILTSHVTPAYAQDADGYQTPEDILLLQMEEGSFPRNARASDALAERQQQRTNTYAQQQAQLHAAAEAEKEAAEAASSSSVKASTDKETPVEDTGKTTDESGKATITLSPEELRLFLRLTQPKTLPSTAALHEGAPLAPSGLPEVATVIVLALAVGWTLWRAEKGEVR